MKKFPKTPTPIDEIGKWWVAISPTEDIFYFWDGKSPAYNFYYRKDSAFVKEMMRGICPAGLCNGGFGCTHA